MEVEMYEQRLPIHQRREAPVACNNTWPSRTICSTVGGGGDARWVMAALREWRLNKEKKKEQDWSLEWNLANNNIVFVFLSSILYFIKDAINEFVAAMLTGNTTACVHKGPPMKVPCRSFSTIPTKDENEILRSVFAR